MLKKKFLQLSLIIILFSSTAFAVLPSSETVDTTVLAQDDVSANVDAQLEKIYEGVREFHIFKVNFGRWSGTDTFTTLVTGQNGFPIFSARSDKDPKYTDYPIDYTSNTIKRYHPVRPPKSVLEYYTNNSIALGNAETSTYNAPLVAGGTIGKGRVIVMGSHLYGSILVNPRNYSNNVRNNNTSNSSTPDSPDMENFFHNVFTWLTEQNTDENQRYSKTGTSIPILSNKEITYFWGTSSAGVNHDKESFIIHDNFNIDSSAKPKYVPTWTEANNNNLLDPSKYPLIILEDFEMSNSWSSFAEHFERKTKIEDVDAIVNYIRSGGGVLIMESPRFLDKYGITETASDKILKKAGISTFFANNHQETKILPQKSEVGGVHQYDMCLLDYISYTDLQRRLNMDDYSNVPTTLEGLKDQLDTNGKISYLEEVLQKRKRNIFTEGNSTKELTLADCGTVELELGDGTKTNVQTTLVKGDGIIQDGDNYDKYAKYPIDLNFVQAQGDVGGSMNSLLAHELNENRLNKVDLNREYTNMSALLLNDAVFTGEKFQSLNDLLDHYKSGGRFVNENGEFYPGFSFETKDILDFRRKPVTRIIVERAFYDKALVYDPSQYPGQTSATGGALTSKIFLKRNRNQQKWYAGNMQSTGLFAPAHQDVTITLPDGIDPKKMRLQIGVGDNVGGIFRHEINLKRPPKYVKSYKFYAENGAITPTITVQHPYGGLIFLKSFDDTADENATATINFTNVQSAIHFVLGTTTSTEWEVMKTSIAPKAELESKHYIVTVPRSSMSNLSFDEVTQIAENFDIMAKNAYDFYGYDQECVAPFTQNTPASCRNNLKLAHKHREVFDPHISVGSGHSGYPIMVMNWNPTQSTFPQDPTASWLLWHEMGHNMVESWLNIPGAGEVANNVMCLYQQKSFGKTLRTANSISSVQTILAKGEPWADGGNFGRLLMFHQLSEWIDSNYMTKFKERNLKYYNTDGSIKAEYTFLKGNGFDIYKILHREARDKTAENDKYDKCMRQNGATKTDMLALCTSAILELNTKSFFQAWKAGTVGIGAVDGIPVYDSTEGISSGLDTKQSNEPSPSIQSFQ